MSQRRGPDDDLDEFERAMADVVRLPSDPRGRVPKVPNVHEPPAEVRHVEPADPAPDAYAAPGVDRRELRRLKRGDHPVQARLDLHGMTVVEARAGVMRFLENSRHAGHRCVCVVHGRGLNSAGGVAVLRQHVRDILMGQAHVLAFAPAPPSDGGSGAVYVLLRR